MEVNTRWVDLPSEAGRMAVFVAESDTAERLPGLVYFHVLPGLNAQHRSMAVRLAAEGYVVAAPDLYHRVGYRTEFDYPREREQAYEARQTISHFGLAADSRVALNYLREHPGVAVEHLGVIGFCMGGTVAYLTAALNRDVRATAAVYGTGIVRNEPSPRTPISPLELSEGITGPVLWISARGDQLVTPEDADAFGRRMSELGKPFESHIYDDESAGHAFFDEDIPEFYHAAAAEWGWPLIVNFLARHLQSPSDT